MSGFVVRERLLARLDEVARHRVTAVVADAGFGKSVLLDQWRDRSATHGLAVVVPEGRDVTGIALALIGAVRQRSQEEASRLTLVAATPAGTDEDRPVALAGMMCAALAALPDLTLALVVDDVHLLGAPAQRFVEAVALQAPGSLHLLLLSRKALPFSVERLGGGVLVLGGADLGFDDAEMSQLLHAVVGDDEDAEVVRSLLGRWPAAVRLAAEALGRSSADSRAADRERLQKHGARDLVTLAHEVVEGEEPATRRLAQVLAPFDGFSVELAEALGCPDAAATIKDLERRGIVVRAGGAASFAFPRLLRDYLRVYLPLDPQQRPALVRAAGAWFEEHGQIEGALRCALDQGDSAWIARLLRENGRALLAGGRRHRVSRALDLVVPEDMDRHLYELAGVVRDGQGDDRGALLCYLKAAEGETPLRPWLAWRTGFLYYQRGELELALRALKRGGPPEQTPDYVQLLAWQATVHWALGQVEEGRLVAVPALALAESLDDPGSLAAAHTIMAMLQAYDGNREANRRHYDIALQQAERANDVMQVVRIRNNRGSRLLEEGELQAALVELEIAIELAEAGGLRFYLSLALANRGELRFHLGQFDAATADLETARDLDQEAGSSSVSSALVHLGHVYRHRGYVTMSRQAYEQAIEAGRRAGDVNLLVPALCGLAQLLAETEGELAQQLADEALSHAHGLVRVGALLAAGWVAWARGDRERLEVLAAEALTEAGRRRDRMGRAEALHLLALADPEHRPDDPRLAEAAALLEQIGAPVWRARLHLEQARRLGGARGLAIIAEVEQRARSLGARALAEQAVRLSRSLDVARAASPVEIATLGGFRVRRHGKALAHTDWPEERGRALLKRLTANPGLHWRRDQLARSLSPGLSPDQADVQLERAIAGARAALDPDRRHPEDHFVAVEGSAVVLRRVDVDVHSFLDEARRGLASTDAIDLLRRAESRYGGDFLEEHPREPWAAGLREQARSRYVEVARALAADALRSGDDDAAARFARRILERDPYDEGAHLALVASLDSAGRPAEARRCYSTYVQRLDELGLDAVPWAQVPESANAPERSHVR